MKTSIKDYWWEDNDLLIETDDGIHRMVNAYVSDIRFGDLDCDSSEEVCINTTMKYSDTRYIRHESLDKQTL